MSRSWKDSQAAKAQQGRGAHRAAGSPQITQYIPTGEQLALLWNKQAYSQVCMENNQPEKSPRESCAWMTLWTWKLTRPEAQTCGGPVHGAILIGGGGLGVSAQIPNWAHAWHTTPHRLHAGQSLSLSAEQATPGAHALGQLSCTLKPGNPPTMAVSP